MTTTHSNAEAELSGRERRRLRLARENAYLAATCPDNRQIAKLHGLWCWKLKVPIVWFERLSPRSRYGRVHLDMLTTANMLTPSGQAAMHALDARFEVQAGTKVSPHDVTWEHVAYAKVEALCRAAFKVAVTANHYQLNQVKPAKAAASSRNVIKFAPRQRQQRSA